MSKSRTRLAALVAATALAVSLSACTAGQWEYDAPPAAGVQVDDGGLKVRNFMILTDGEQAALLGGLHSRDEAAQVAGLEVAAEGEDGTFAEPQRLPYETDIPRGQTVLLDGTETSFSGEGLIAGRLAEVSVLFAGGTVVKLQVPVYSAEHQDFAEAWANANV